MHVYLNCMTSETKTLLDINSDCLKLIFYYAPLPHALKLSCKELSTIGPKETRTRVSQVVTSVSVLRWARQNGFCWDWRTCAEAASGGFLEVLSFAFDEGCEWNDDTCTLAAMGGHLDVVAFARKNGCVFNACACLMAARGGHMNILEHVYCKSFGIIDWDHRTCDEAAACGHLDLLIWLKQKGCPWNSGTCARAALGGHLHVLQWAYKNGCEWDWETCDHAAQGGHLHVLKWVRENGCEWKSTTTTRAAEGGHLQTLKWAIGEGCTLNWEDVCPCAARKGHVHILEWIRETRRDLWDYSETEVLRASVRHNQIDVLKWFSNTVY